MKSDGAFGRHTRKPIWTCSRESEPGLRHFQSGSPFANEKDVRRFAGPLPFTFDYEPETHSIIRIRGVREHWNPQSVEVEVRKSTFLQQEPFCRATPILANAFHLHDVPYRWMRGVRIPLEAR